MYPSTVTAADAAVAGENVHAVGPLLHVDDPKVTAQAVVADAPIIILPD